MIIALAPPNKAHAALLPILGEGSINDEHPPCVSPKFNVRHTRSSRVQTPLKTVR